MKKILIAIIAISSLATMPSCKKCYKCSNSTTSRTVCEGDEGYNFAKNDGAIPDINGNGLYCAPK